MIQLIPACGFIVSLKMYVGCQLNVHIYAASAMRMQLPNEAPFIFQIFKLVPI